MTGIKSASEELSLQIADIGIRLEDGSALPLPGADEAFTLACGAERRFEVLADPKNAEAGPERPLRVELTLRGVANCMVLSFPI